MQITIKLFATLRDNREKIMVWEVDDTATPEVIIRQLDIPVDEVAIIMINGRGAKRDTPLHADDVLALFPPVGGG